MPRIIVLNDDQDAVLHTEVVNAAHFREPGRANEIVERIQRAVEQDHDRQAEPAAAE